MLDIRAIRENPALIEARLQRRDPEISLAGVLAADQRRRALLLDEEELRHRQKECGPKAARLGLEAADLEKQGKHNEADDALLQMKSLVVEMTAIKQRLQTIADDRRAADEALDAALLDLPNLPHDSVPVSPDKHDNQVIRTFGAKPGFDFEPLHHVALAERLGLLDFERGAKVAGSGWPCYRGLGARLEWALINFCVERGVRDGFEPVMPPLAVNAGVMTSAGVLPKFQEQVYVVERDDLYLIPTAEIVLTGLYADEILPVEALPLKMMSYTPCFRREAGAHGAGERGLIRVHQFNKCERYILCRPEDSYHQLEALTHQVESLVSELGLHFVTTLLVTGDIAQQAAKTYDIEVWLPGQRAYFEVSSASNCEDYQARRGKIRFRPEPEAGGKAGGKAAKPELVHTLNGSALATSRLLAAILETNQQADGSVVVPPVLRPYLGGLEVIEPR
jgi:seryl-tRNA synthetase